MPFYTSQAASVCAHSDALRSHVAFCLDTTCKYWTSIGFPTSGHMLMQHARMISGARHRRYVRTYVRTYVRMCSCSRSARNCTHRAHWIQDAIIQYTYVRSGPNRAGGFNKKNAHQRSCSAMSSSVLSMTTWRFSRRTTTWSAKWTSGFSG